MGILKRKKKDEKANRQGLKLGRREIMKFGAGAAAAGALAVPAALAQQERIPPISPNSPLAPAPHGNLQHFPDIRESQEVITSIQPYYITKTGPGWKNDSGRAFGNGPM